MSEQAAVLALEDLGGEGVAGGQVEWDYGDRDLPTPEEEGFARLLMSLEPRCDCYLYNDDDGTPWMLMECAVPGSSSLSLRVDFDARGVRGGVSASCLNWDLGVRAERPGVLREPPARFEVSAQGLLLAELAEATYAAIVRFGAEYAAMVEANRRQPRPRRGWLRR